MYNQQNTWELNATGTHVKSWVEVSKSGVETAPYGGRKEVHYAQALQLMHPPQTVWEDLLMDVLSVLS